MGRISYAYASTIMVMNIITLVIIPLLIISPCNAREYDLIHTDHDFFVIYDDRFTDHYLGLCLFESGNYTHQSEYQSNLLNVFSNLTTAAATPKTTFSNETMGSGLNTVHGSFNCMVTDLDVCSPCVRNATIVLQDMCPSKAGVVYSVGMNCQVSYYANISAIQETDSLTNCADEDIMPRAPDPAVFNQTIMKSIKKLINQVVVIGPAYYAEDFIPDLYFSQKIHTGVWCFPGVNTSLCKDCLLHALNQTEFDCLSIGKAYAVGYQPSCRIAYSTVTSLAPVSSSPAPPPLPRSPHSSSASSAASPCIADWPVDPLWTIAATVILQRMICTGGRPV